MIARRLALCAALGFAVAACAAGPSPSATPLVINVSLSDAMRIEPAAMEVPAGVPVTFRITNTGAIEHEFYLGDEQAQLEHELEMAEGGMVHHDPQGVTVAPGGSEELTWTFTPGEWLAGCHIPGHYPAGMKATIEVAP